MARKLRILAFHSFRTSGKTFALQVDSQLLWQACNGIAASEQQSSLCIWDSAERVRFHNDKLLLLQMSRAGLDKALQDLVDIVRCYRSCLQHFDFWLKPLTCSLKA